VAARLSKADIEAALRRNATASAQRDSEVATSRSAPLTSDDLSHSREAAQEKEALNGPDGQAIANAAKQARRGRGKGTPLPTLKPATPNDSREKRPPLLDLYCGYGLFAFRLAPHFGSLTGIDLSGPAIESANANAHYRKLPARFLAASVDAPSLARLTKQDKEVIVLDPPRGGTAPGVIEALAKRTPQKVLHVFCSIDRLVEEVERWRAAGYKAERLEFVDLFPGTANLEALVLLSPAT
jgi:methylase of polypeptide subunit release factors